MGRVEAPPPPPSLLISVSFSPSFCLFRSPLSLIVRQTACKCSNPEKSPGAVLIGCAPRHSSQSIKARWAPVNSFSLLLPLLWYRHIDSNFTLNPSNSVCSLRSFSLLFSRGPESPAAAAQRLLSFPDLLLQACATLSFLSFSSSEVLAPPHRPCLSS